MPNNDNQPSQPSQPIAGIRGDTLFVQVPLSLPNAELIAYGLLISSQNMVRDFFAERALRARLSSQARANGNKAEIDARLSQS